ncbi:hypothetical protein ACQKWADRAFT_293977 [Trichoderma austrokoningii]
METALSPVKRRAVLGAKDANAALATPNTNKITRIATPMLSTPSATSPLRQSPEKGTKRAAEGADESPEAKKTCVDGTAQSRSPSIESSSLFDTSAGDASWATAPTEPDTATRPRALTREQAREKAEILRLRLSLAGYKLRTGQTAIPLSELQRRPLPSQNTTARKRASTILPHAKPTSSTHGRAQSVGSVPMLSQEEDATTVSASQESVVLETRGNTPDGGDSGGNESDRAGLPCKVFQSSPAVVPVSSLRSTCTDTAS